MGDLAVLPHEIGSELGRATIALGREYCKQRFSPDPTFTLLNLAVYNRKGQRPGLCDRYAFVWEYCKKWFSPHLSFITLDFAVLPPQ